MTIRLLENAKTDSSVALTRLTDLGFYTGLPIVNLVTAITAGNRHETKFTIITPRIGGDPCGTY